VAFVLTLVYLILTIVSPLQLGKVFADYHPMIYLAGITAVASFPCMMTHSYAWSALQSRLMLGFVAAIAMSQIANGLFGGALESLRDILPVAAVFFLLVVNVTTVRRLKIATLTTMGTCLAVTTEAFLGYYGGFRGDMFVLLQEQSSQGQIPRLRAAGFLSDPNDLAQILLIALPLVFVSWNRGQTIRNVFFVFVPSAFLLWAIYLTHSRGALLALGALILVVFHNKIGRIPSVFMAGALVFGMMALHFTGGRGISAVEGADRLELWAEGLQLFRSAPLFGMGFGRFTDFIDLTAHNSFVLCLAELGLVGSTILVALFVTTMLDLNRMITIPETLHAVPDSQLELESEVQLTPLEWEASSCEIQTATLTVTDGEVTADVEADEGGGVLRPFAVAMRLALVSFISTSVFLSRSYTTTMYLMLGLATATIALQPNTVEVGPRNRWILITLLLEALAIAFIYCIVRFRH
jgi:putative inorganic carbon (HCO3(-)) transporter